MTAAEVLAQHWMDEDQDCVKCNRHFNRIAEFAAHQLDALKAAGYAVVELPAPNQYDEWAADQRGASAPWFVWLSSRNMQVRTSGYATPSYAREFAAALLAAADAAEVDR